MVKYKIVLNCKNCHFAQSEGFGPVSTKMDMSFSAVATLVLFSEGFSHVRFSQQSLIHPFSVTCLVSIHDTHGIMLAVEIKRRVMILPSLRELF